LLKLSTVISFAFSRARKTVAVGCSCGHIALIDWTTGKDVEFSSRHPGFFCDPVIFFNDGSTMLISDARSNRLSLRDARTGKELRQLSEGRVLTWSPDGKRLVHTVSGGWNERDSKYLQVKDAGSGKEVWKADAWPTEAWFSSDAKLLTYWDLNDRTFHQVDANTGKPQHIFHLPPRERQDAEPSAISTDQKHVAVKAKRGARGAVQPDWKELQIWDIDGNKLWSWSIPEDWEREGWNVLFLPKNKHLVLEAYVPSQQAGVILILDAATGKKVRELPTAGRYSHLASSPDGHSIVLAGKKTIEVRDVATGRLLFEYEPTGMRSYLHRLAFAPNGKLCAFSADDFTIEVRELATGKLVATFHRPTYFVRSITFAPDSRTIALAFNDCTIWMWDALAKPAKRVNR
jgi:WD40 repeat protein